jgi:hypothetical protein
VAEKSVFHAWRIRLLVSVACADCDTPLNLLDCLVDYLDGVDPVTAFVVRGLHELIARPIQGIERPFHVTLVGMGVLDQRNSGDDENEDLAEKSGSHKKFQSLPRKNAMEICPRARKFVSARFTTRGALAAALLSTGLFRGQTLDPFKNFPSIGGRVKRRAAFADKNKNRN